MPNASPVLQALRSHPNLDPNAVLRVAGAEGLSGGIGDGGHAFGPFQLNNAGGVLTGKFQGQSPQQINQWAWSPQGINYALSGIDRVAGGQHGSQAVNSIVRRFERPADPNGEVARALGGGVSTGGAAMSSPSVGMAAAPGTNSRQQFVQSLLGAISPTGQLDSPTALVQALQTRRAAWDEPGQGTRPLPPPTGLYGGGQGAPAGKPHGLAELLLEGTGGPTHSTGPHVHAAFTDPNFELAAIAEAQKMGLHVGENPYVGSMPAPGVHAAHSYHYRDFPGSYGGKKLGEAIDVSGSQQQQFYAWLQQRQAGRA